MEAGAGAVLYGRAVATDNAFWHGFWSNKLAMMGRRGVAVFKRQLVYRNKTIQVPGFGATPFLLVKRREST